MRWWGREKAARSHCWVAVGCTNQCWDPGRGSPRCPPPAACWLHVAFDGWDSQQVQAGCGWKHLEVLAGSRGAVQQRQERGHAAAAARGSPFPAAPEPETAVVWGNCWELRPNGRCSCPAWEGAAFPRGGRHTSSTPAPSHFISTSPPRHGSAIPAPRGQEACEAAGCCCPPLPTQCSRAQDLSPRPALLISALPGAAASSCSPASPPQAPDECTQPSSWLPLPLFSPTTTTGARCKTQPVRDPSPPPPHLMSKRSSKAMKIPAGRRRGWRQRKAEPSATRGRAWAHSALSWHRDSTGTAPTPRGDPGGSGTHPRSSQPRCEAGGARTEQKKHSKRNEPPAWCPVAASPSPGDVLPLVSSPGMTMSPSPSMAKLSASRPFSSRS